MITQISCRDCKYWKAPGPNDYREVTDLGECSHAPMFWNATKWREEPEEGRTYLPEYVDRLFFVQDGSDYYATLLTKENFYCAHATAKESP